MANLFQLPTFRQMNISLDRLKSAGRILFSFNGATTVTMGDITLLVRAGSVVQQVLFLVLEDLGLYNAIVSRAWLHAMKVVPSTYHQMINYLTNIRQVDLLSSQLATRQCYQLSVQESEEKKAPTIWLKRPRPQNSNYRSPPKCKWEIGNNWALTPWNQCPWLSRVNPPKLILSYLA